MIIDLDADSAEIVGKGGLTLRRDGASIRHEAGSTIALDVIRSGGSIDATAAVPTTAPTDTSGKPTPDDTPANHDAALGLAATARAMESKFNDALAAGDSQAAVAAVLDLDAAIVEWSADTLQSDEMDQARRSLRSMIVKLGTAATDGLRDPRRVLGPVVEAALAARRVAREEKAYAVSDAVRDGLDAAGIEVRDTADGVEWVIRS